MQCPLCSTIMQLLKIVPSKLAQEGFNLHLPNLVLKACHFILNKLFVQIAKNFVQIVHCIFSKVSFCLNLTKKAF